MVAADGGPRAAAAGEMKAAGAAEKRAVVLGPWSGGVGGGGGGGDRFRDFRRRTSPVAPIDFVPAAGTESFLAVGSGSLGPTSPPPLPPDTSFFCGSAVIGGSAAASTSSPAALSRATQLVHTSVVWRLLARPFQDSRDVPEERCRKEVLMPAVIAWALACTFFSVRKLVSAGMGTLEWNLDDPGVLATWCACVALILSAMISRRLPLIAVELFVVFHGAVVLPLVDWQFGAENWPAVWPWGFLVIDILLLLDARRWAVAAAMASLSAWVLLRCCEESGRFGMWEWPRRHTPRDALGWEALPVVIVIRFVPIVMVFFLTQAFEGSLREEQVRMRAAIAAAEAIASDLQHYDVQSAAQRVVEASRQLPPGLLRAFEGLLQNLSEYRTYLPQAVLPAECIESEGETDSDSGSQPDRKLGSMGTGSSGSGNLAAARRRQGTQRFVARDLSIVDIAKGRRRSKASSRSSQSYPSRPSFRTEVSPDPESMLSLQAAPSVAQLLGGRKMPQQLESQDLKVKSVTLVACNVRGYLRLARLATLDSLVDLHHDMLTQLVEKTSAQKALTDGASGDRYFASLNTGKNVSQHQAKGARLGWSVQSIGFKEMVRVASTAQSMETAHDEDLLQLSTGVFCGEAVCGVLGCDTFRRYQVIGATATWVHALERLASGWSAAVVVNGAVKSDSETSFLYRLRDKVGIKKHSHLGLRQHTVWECLGARDQQPTEEWMYQLARQQASDPWQMYNKAREAFVNGRYDAAISGADACRQMPAPIDALASELHQEACARPVDPTSSYEEAVLHRRIAAQKLSASGLGLPIPQPPTPSSSSVEHAGPPVPGSVPLTPPDPRAPATPTRDADGAQPV
eukprot:TRINITY_DN252_c2_g1_i1.p1 TRINITY_DN252_c2_g1~~TRINITY_DN252_c2_g1_i1.p1  ORF type:complete len:886 (+),score=302.24 TRINITY_DN252_c2_g1_i1:96-2660(+)